MNDKLRPLLIRHEGIRLQPYMDTVGKLTIGIGRNLSDRGISREEAFFMFENDIGMAIEDTMSVLPNLFSFTENRQNALVDMMFNLGLSRFKKFVKMISSINSNDWPGASAAMKDSLWFTQVPTRAAELARMVENG